MMILGTKHIFKYYSVSVVFEVLFNSCVVCMF